LSIFIENPGIKEFSGKTNEISGNREKAIPKKLRRASLDFSKKIFQNL